MPTVAVVRGPEFQALVRRVPFLALLPREEIDRLHAAIEMLAVDDATLRHTAEFCALYSHIAIHHNYSWLTFRGPNAQRTLLLSTALAAERSVPLFLGEELLVSATRQVEERLGLNGGCEMRLAGILQKVDGGQPLRHVGLLSIARLADRTATSGAGCQTIAGWQVSPSDSRISTSRRFEFGYATTATTPSDGVATRSLCAGDGCRPLQRA